eukprot:CAMPEP_0113626212 /NCGR_PEP_ID=MMETSP0017_2-20120614/13556_1 /TAXON_ID=2856 /ORGANISM="Cylindrotheca closterium" /LENGTH=470 /DNA_ID=CAMNT_0000536385 /DNA_START=12 /DNA_END=1424 /DNA_ORIENTATION=+ /assembly_acc=CAM_ASM_000147
MKVLIACVGSRGDVEPYVAIADRLLQDGHQVEFVVQPELKHLVPTTTTQAEKNNNNSPIHVHEWSFTQYDFYMYAANPTRGAELEGRFKFTAIVADILGELVLPNWKMVLDAAAGCDLVITSTLARPLCFAVAQKLKLPTVLINLQPIVPTKLFPHFSQQDDFVQTLLDLNKTTEDATTAAVDGSDEFRDYYLTLEKHQHDFLQERLDKMYEEMELESSKMDFDTLQEILTGHHPAVFVGNAFFDTLIPKIADGGPNVHHISSLADHYIPNDFEPPQKVVDFLNQSRDKPICVGFGSMPYSQVSLILKALKKLGQRAILIGKALELPKPEDDGDGNDDGLSDWVQKNVLQAHSLPYAWLLPQCQMMLSHGGAGVTQATLRAGIPPVIGPFMGDQFVFADLMEAKGLGARVGVGRSLGEATEDDFVAAMEKAMTCIEAAKPFGENVRSRPLGVDNLMKLITEQVVLPTNNK